MSRTRSAPEPLEQPGGDAEGAAVDADVLADEEDPLVGVHRWLSASRTASA